MATELTETTERVRDEGPPATPLRDLGALRGKKPFDIASILHGVAEVLMGRLD